MFTQDFIYELREQIADAVYQRIKNEQQTAEVNKVRLNGVRGIAKFLGCTPKTAQSLKDKGLFPVYWIGKNLYAYSDEVEAGLKDRRR